MCVDEVGYDNFVGDVDFVFVWIVFVCFDNCVVVDGDVGCDEFFGY